MRSSLFAVLVRGGAVCCFALVAAGPATAVAQAPPVGPGAGQPPVRMPGQDWWIRAPVYRSKYYNIKTDLDPAEAKIMAEHMDTTFAAYWGLFSKLPVRLQRPATLDLYLFGNQQDYVNVLALRFKSDATGSWGKCITSGKSISLVGWKGHHSLEDLKQLVQHEGFHQVSSHLFTGTPLWAEEGMAELFERGVAVGDQLVVGEFPPRDKAFLVKGIEGQEVMPLERFLSIGSDEWSARVRAGSAQLQYLQAWSVVHFLVFAENGKYETPFLNFLVHLNRRVDWRQAFVASFGVPDFKALEAQWIQYVRDIAPSDYRETLRRLRFLAAGMVALHAQEIHPASIEELQTELRAIAFECDSDMPDAPQRMSAQDARLFQIPLAADLPDRRFVLVESRATSSGTVARKKPLPMTIVAEGLYPQVFVAEWNRRSRDPGYVFSAKPWSQYKARSAPEKETGHAEAELPGTDPSPSEVSPEQPAPPSTAMRTWTSADGKFTTVADLISYAAGIAKLRRSDGTVIQVRRDQLSEADQEFLDRRAHGTP